MVGKTRTSRCQTHPQGHPLCVLGGREYLLWLVGGTYILWSQDASPPSGTPPLWLGGGGKHTCTGTPPTLAWRLGEKAHMYISPLCGVQAFFGMQAHLTPGYIYPAFWLGGDASGRPLPISPSDRPSPRDIPLSVFLLEGICPVNPPNSPTARTPSPKRDQHTDHCGLFQNFFNFFWTSGFLGKLGNTERCLGGGKRSGENQSIADVEALGLFK